MPAIKKKDASAATNFKSLLRSEQWRICETLNVATQKIY